LIAIEIESEYISIARSLSRQDLKGKPNAPITDESEITYLLRWLKLIRQSESSMIAIRVEAKYRSINRSLSGWDPAEITRDRFALEAVLPVCEPEVLACCYRRLR
jgi:hypothetical protein